MTVPPPPQRPLARALAGVLVLTTAPALAEEAAEEEQPLKLETVTVEAAKLPTAIADITGTVTVINAERLERELAQNISDLVRYEPGVDVVDQGSRFGRAGFNIRGLGGNRVLVEVDGAPVSDAFAIGDFSNASRDFVDVDSLKQVEIVRGPSSALFGSDALGGVVSFVTKDPRDYLDGDDLHLRATAGYWDIDASLAGSATAAARAGDWGALLTATYREGEERNDTGADPLDYDTLNFLGKLTWRDPLAGGLKFTVEDFQGESTSRLLSQDRVQDFSDAFGFPYLITTSDSRADDERSRHRLGLEQGWNEGVGFTDFLRWRVFWQDSETTQDTFQQRETFIAGTPGAAARDRRFEWQQTFWGGEVNAATEFTFVGVEHELAYGVEFERADTEQRRDGRELNLLTGESGNQLGPDTFPVRDFPISETESVGIYLQDSFTLGPVTLIPAVRWDRFEVTPKPDAIYLEDNPGIEPTGLDDSEWSPKLGLLWDLTEDWQLFAQYSEGFRAPPVNDVNVGFTNFQFGYTALPNPDLKSESSRGYEAGVRFSGATAEWEISAFRSDYDDFIEPFQVVGFDPVDNLIIFQSVNLTSVRIEGVEVRGQWSPNVFPDGLYLRFAGSWTEGDNEENGQPLNSVAPPNAVLGFDYAPLADDWGASFLARGALRQDRLDETEGPVLSPEGFVAFDLTAWWKPTDDTRLRAGLFNLLDEDYTAYLDVAGLPADTPDTERFRRPGRNFTLAFDWTFN